MTTFALNLYSERQPELHSTVFCHPLVGTRRCIRGKSAGSHVGDGSFHWTNAVRALVVLAVRTVHADLTDLPYAKLEGQGRCLARSLDLALSKQPLWLIDMFGISANGNCMARRLFVRNNAEGKMPGPQSIAFNRAAIRADAITLVWDGRAVTSPSAVTDLLLSLDAEFTCTHYGMKYDALSLANNSFVRDRFANLSRRGND